MDDIPLDAVDDTAGKKGRGKAERGPIDISETPEDDATVSKGGGKGDDGSDAVETSVTASVTATTESPFENGIVLPGADDYAQLPEQVPGGLVQSKLKCVSIGRCHSWAPWILTIVLFFRYT